MEYASDYRPIVRQQRKIELHFICKHSFLFHLVNTSGLQLCICKWFTLLYTLCNEKFPRFSILWLILMLWLLNHHLVLHLMRECRKWYFRASRFQSPPPWGRGLTGPEVLQPPPLIGSAAYFRTC